MNETITIYDYNTLALQCVVSGLDTITGYSATFYVKQKYTDDTALIMNTGTTSGQTATFAIDYTENDLPPAQYIYEVRLVSDINIYSVAQGRFIVKDSIVTI